TGETRLRFWALAGQPPAVVPTNRKQAVPRSRNRGTNYPRSALVPTIALFAGIATKLSIDSDFDNGLVIGAFTGIAAVLILGPIFLKWQNGRDQQRLDSQLED
ncbi:hypothetical protein ACOJA8_09760, partial [Corynebacterium striatum]